MTPETTATLTKNSAVNSARLTTRAIALLGTFLASCGRSPTIDRARELAGCQLISESGDALAKCLVLKYSWSADSAASAMYAWQRQLDSLRGEHEAQAAAVIAQQDSIRRAVIAQQDSIRRVADRARLEQLARRAAPWASCISE